MSTKPTQKNHRQEIRDFFSSFPHMLTNDSYHSELPSDIAEWHCYITDAGHSILSLPKCFADNAFATNLVHDFLVPICVKTALRGYQIREGYVVVDVEYDSNFGAICPDGDEEYGADQSDSSTNESPTDAVEFHTIGNRGQAIAETNYWDSKHATAGLFYLSWNAGAGRVLVPDCQKHMLREMRGAKYVIVSRGPWPEQGGRDSIELLFEDNTDCPFSLQLSMGQCDRILPESDHTKDFFVTVWTRGGEKLRFPGRYRVVKRIPCLEEWVA